MCIAADVYTGPLFVNHVQEHFIFRPLHSVLRGGRGANKCPAQEFVSVKLMEILTTFSVSPFTRSGTKQTSYEVLKYGRVSSFNLPTACHMFMVNESAIRLCCHLNCANKCNFIISVRVFLFEVITNAVFSLCFVQFFHYYESLCSVPTTDF